MRRRLRKAGKVPSETRAPCIAVHYEDLDHDGKRASNPKLN